MEPDLRPYDTTTWTLWYYMEPDLRPGVKGYETHHPRLMVLGTIARKQGHCD